MFKHKKKEDIDLGGNKFDVINREKYITLEPVWTLLENIPEDMKIKSDILWEKTRVEPTIGNQLLQELFQEFQNKMITNILDLVFNQDELVYSWLLDKMMLLVTRVDTGNNITALIDNPIMNDLKEKWRTKRGL
jgi:hypothetical protein